MFDKTLIISLGVTSLASIAIWFYFKEKISINEIIGIGITITGILIILMYV